MRVLRLLTFLLALLASGAATADDKALRDLCALDDSTRLEERIAACTTLIDAGSGTRDELTDALYNRAEAMGRAGQNESAIADLDEVLRRRPIDAWAFSVRGFVQRARGNTALALADYEEALTLREAAGDFAARGQTRMLTGDFSGAQADLRTALGMEAGDAYIAIWLDIALKRAGLEGHFTSLETAGVEPSSWQAALVRHLMGELPLARLQAAARNASERVAREQRCEADFYAAEMLLANARATAAVPLFKAAAANCPAYYIEKGSALAELKRMGL